MNSKEILENIISPSIETANLTMPNFKLDQLNQDTIFYGKENAVLDSLNLVSFIFIIEEQIEKVTQKKVTITTQDVLDSNQPPFLNLENLTLFINKKITVFDHLTWRPYCHVKDFAKVIYSILHKDIKRKKFEIFNVGSSKNNYTKIMILEKIKKYIKRFKIIYKKN